jgi:hypothetical protein
MAVFRRCVYGHVESSRPGTSISNDYKGSLDSTSYRIGADRKAEIVMVDESKDGGIHEECIFENICIIRVSQGLRRLVSLAHFYFTDARRQTEAVLPSGADTAA